MKTPCDCGSIRTHREGDRIYCDSCNRFLRGVKKQWLLRVIGKIFVWLFYWKEIIKLRKK